ncbi:hypothetical protein QQP08_010160 [Theobroma cacao]|uniref:F-box family protein, putative n=1 Tax=Theobroma cacao TaxID=3641 RepID=A0A061G0Z9_THECC|nr:F-box family protein, putative [Theobroma cacao]WRX17673.1 hypothetical protein QQP08_010160 [Theobroma cacao]
MHARFTKTFKVSPPLHFFLFSLSILISGSPKTKRRNQIKNFQNFSKLKKTRKGNKRSSCQGSPKVKKRRKSKTNLFPNIFSLPNELMTEVLARVAAYSFHDFFDVKLSCKVFHQIADDKYILQHVSLEKFPVTPWCSTKQSFFLEKCKRSGHPEALYREGVVEHFSFARVEEGLNCLNSAAKVGHLGASYVLGVILLCTEEPDQEQDGRRLLKLEKSKKGVRESRKKLNDTIRNIWLNNLLEGKPNCCPMRDQHRRRRGWPSDNEDDVDCEACGCDLEVIFVCNLLRGILTY